MMMMMKIGKRTNRVLVSLDDETFMLLSHAAAYERKELSTYIGHLIEQQVHGFRVRLPADLIDHNENHPRSE